MSVQPLISVILPFFNNLSTIERCVESVLSQTFRDFEIVLVDDGSCDGSAEVVHSLIKDDNRARLIRQDNQGVSAARNTGLDYAIGEYITFCDADDYYGPHWLSGLYSKNNDSDIVFGNYTNIDDSGTIIKTTAFKPGTYCFRSKQDRLDYIITHVFQKGCAWTVWSSIFKREIISSNTIRFNLDCANFGEDLGFVLECILCSNQVSIAEMDSYYYVTHTGSMSERNNEVIRMNSLNEVSVGFFRRSGLLGYKQYEKHLAIIHFLIMYGQYYKVIGKENYPYLKGEIDKIDKKDHFYRMARILMHSYKEMCMYTDRKTAKQILLFTHYCLHGNWGRFKIESALFYRYFFR